MKLLGKNYLWSSCSKQAKGFNHIHFKSAKTGTKTSFGTKEDIAYIEDRDFWTTMEVRKIGQNVWYFINMHTKRCKILHWFQIQRQN